MLVICFSDFGVIVLIGGSEAAYAMPPPPRSRRVSTAAVVRVNRREGRRRRCVDTMTFPSAVVVAMGNLTAPGIQRHRRSRPPRARSWKISPEIATEFLQDHLMGGRCRRLPCRRSGRRRG